ncbi:MAG: hypothetical protein ACHBN1_07725 [Heteroscytonema crispum UTEX LB 1556]
MKSPVTFFVGENGSVKSTFLSAIAADVGSITVGGEDIQQDKTLDPARQLSTQFYKKVGWLAESTAPKLSIISSLDDYL